MKGEGGVYHGASTMMKRATLESATTDQDRVHGVEVFFERTLMPSSGLGPT